MLKDLKKYQCLGTPNYFFELVTELSAKNKKWNEDDLRFLFYNRIIDNRPIIDGGVYLALFIGLLKKDLDKIYFNQEFRPYIANLKMLKEGFVSFLFKAIKENDILPVFLSPEFITYDMVYNSLQISNRAFGFKFSNIKQLFLDFEIIIQHPQKQFKSYLINPKFRNVFDSNVLPLIKKKRLSVEELKKSLEQQQIYGEEAEKFVLEFERKRLNGVKNIIWIAQYIANEGYDITSYNTPTDKLPNRFIEVKSFEGNTPYFYWSKNEVETSKLKGLEYWVYLVNRMEMTKENYSPIMIQNPYETILSNQNWIKKIENYKVILNK